MESLSWLSTLVVATRSRHHFGAPNQDARINTQCPTDETKDDDRTDSDSARAAPGNAAQSPAPIFNSAALGQVI